jgi:hypothetical protein
MYVNLTNKNKAATNIRTTHTVDELNVIINRLHRVLDSIKNLSGNIETGDEQVHKR